MAKVTYNNKAGNFYPTLKQKVEDYFQKTGKTKTGTWHIYHKAVVLFSLALFFYFSLIFQWFGLGVNIFMCIALGAVLASIGFNVMHDACHGSYSKKSWFNEIMGYSLNIMGGSSYLWKQKHNVIHHTYTNVDGLDDDIAKSPIIRHCHTQKWVPAHKVQHFYLPLVYSLSTLFWIFGMDFVKYFSGKINNTKAWKMDTKEHIIFWATKIFYVAVYIAIPIYMVGFLPWLAGYFIMNAAMGFILGIVFQLAHVVENTHFYSGYEDMHIEQEWAVSQVLTTANFARHSAFINWYVGGLNFQIEHHLFPKISHTHYPAISEIVKETCEEFNIPYNDYPDMWTSVKSHFKMMKIFGQDPQFVPANANHHHAH